MTSLAGCRASSSEKILVRGVNWLGDAVMTTPALLRLRQARPEAHITLFTPQKLADLWTEHPAVDAVWTFSKEESLWSIARRLREGRFQIGLVLPNSHRSALELWLARVPQRIGRAAPWRNWCLTQRVRSPAAAVRMRKRTLSEIRRLLDAGPADASGPPRGAAFPPEAHHAHQYLHLAASLGANPVPLPPFLHVAAEEVEAVRRKFLPADATPWFALNPGAEYGPAKRWPRDRFVAAAAEIQKQTRGRWVVCGGRTDVDLATQIATELTQHAVGNSLSAPINLAGRTSLRELCALLKGCRVLLTNDTGPMHVAAALGTPVVAIFGSTSPELTGPGLPGAVSGHLLKSSAPCSPCFRRECPIDFRCMTGIGVPRVVAAVLKASESGGGKKL